MIDIREMTVLVVDDMENMYSSIRSIMRLLKFGRRYFYAENGEKALKLLKEGEEQIDLTILDNNMPGMKGVEVLEIIREDKELRAMPVVMITADATMDFVTNAAESEIDAYLLKPITVDLLKQKIPPVIENANNPAPMTCHLRNAARFEEKGDLDAAIEETKLAIEANPKSSKPIRDLGQYHLKKGNCVEAEEYLLKAAKMNKVDVVAFSKLGDLYLKLDKIDNALKYYSKAVEISPRHYERSLNLGKILIQRNMVDKAVKVFNNVFHLSKNPLVLKEEIANYCIEEGAQEYAAKLLKDIVVLDKSRGDLMEKIGEIFAEAGNSDEAIAYFAEAEQLDNKNTGIKINIAEIYLSQGMLLRAEKPLKEVLKINPDHKEARDLLMDCL